MGTRFPRRTLLLVLFRCYWSVIPFAFEEVERYPQRSLISRSLEIDFRFVSDSGKSSGHEHEQHIQKKNSLFQNAALVMSVSCRGEK